jgi:hypothetical protein
MLILIPICSLEIELLNHARIISRNAVYVKLQRCKDKDVKI